MLLYTLGRAITIVISLAISPLTFVNNIFGNILQNGGLINLIRFSTFIFDPVVITFAIDTMVFWFGAFIIRPIINFIRNRG